MLRRKIEGMACRDCPDEKTVYRVMDLEIIKYNGLKRGTVKKDDEICAVIDRLIHQFLWLHEKGLSAQSRMNDVLELLESSDDKEMYQQYADDYAKFNEFIKTHASLKEGI